MSNDKDWDGIVQADNKLPAWYVWTFIGTIIFAVVYMFMYHVTDDWTQARAFKEDVAAHVEKFGSSSDSSGENLSADKNPFSGDADSIAAGEETFKAICAACHGQNAEGLVGPSLADSETLYGSSEKVVFNVIMDGRMENLKQNPPKGPMPAHKQSLGAKKVWQVISYLDAKYNNIQ
ncbi:MAG: c-type cytochrome [Spirochaetia bacterium]|nr:c-type cytochrome [Spirochaetia bacterium]